MAQRTVGYCVMVSLDKGKSWWPMSHGVGGEPEPSDMLRRGRVEVFSSRDAAETAIETTAKRAALAKHEWVKKARVQIVAAVTERQEDRGDGLESK